MNLKVLNKLNVMIVTNNWDDSLKAKAITNALIVGHVYSMDGIDKFELVEWCKTSHTMRYMLDGKEEIYYNMRLEKILTIKKLH